VGAHAVPGSHAPERKARTGEERAATAGGNESGEAVAVGEHKR